MKTLVLISLIILWLYRELHQSGKKCLEDHAALEAWLNKNFDFINRLIDSCTNQEQLLICDRMISERLWNEEALFLRKKLADNIQVHLCGLISQQYPVTEE